MAGGTFSSMNKVRPGAYINFEAVPDEVSYLGERGIATIALPLNWGGENSLIEVTADNMVTGSSLAKIGLVNTDAEAKLINLILQNCNTLKIYNTNKNGVKASVTLQDTYVLTSDTQIVSGKTYYTRSGAGTSSDPYEYTAVVSPDVSDIATYYEKLSGVTVTAKHPGTFGNKIAIVITKVNDVFVVETYANGYYIETQKVTSVSELVSNDYVDFGTTGTLATNAANLVNNDFVDFTVVGDGSLVNTSSTLLAGGTNGTTMDGTEYLTNEKYFGLLKATKWNTLASTSTVAADKTAIINFIRAMRENEGKYVQGVIANAADADYEGIINVVNGVVLNNTDTISAAEFTTWVAGATAGANMTDSLTGMIIPNATSIVDLLDNDQIIEGLQNGKFILSLNQDGSIKVEKDINSLHTFTEGKKYMFSKNRVIRELDEIGSGIENIWEQTYLGKVANNEEGRALFKSSIIGYMTDLQNEGAIQEFDASQVIVEAGNDIDSVIASLLVKPVDSMEFLYMTINID